MKEHVLLFGGGGERPGLLRKHHAVEATSMICRIDVVRDLKDVHGHHHVIGLRKDAPHEDWIRAARAVHDMKPVTRLATFFDRDQTAAAAVAVAMNLPFHAPSTVHRVHDKRAMRARLRECGLDDTDAEVAGGPEDLARAAGRMRLPCIVKPIAGAASKGIAKLERASDADACYAAVTRLDPDLWRDGVLVETFHAGPQFSVEAFSEGGEHVVVAVTRKFSHPRTYVELGHLTPAPLAAADRQAIERYVLDVLDALEITFGPTHTELVLTPDGPRIIETHLRCPGDNIPDLVLGATGVSMVDYHVRQVAGELVLDEIRARLAEPREPRHEAIWFASTPNHGTLVEIRPPAGTYDGATVSQELAAGALVDGRDGSFSRVARSRASASSPDEALAIARSAIERLEIVIKTTANTSDVV